MSLKWSDFESKVILTRDLRTEPENLGRKIWKSQTRQIHGSDYEIRLISSRLVSYVLAVPVLLAADMSYYQIFEISD